MKFKLLLLSIIVNSVIFCNAQNAGNALNFDGTDAYCTSILPTVFNSISTNDFTVECWVKIESNSGSKRVFFAQNDANNFCSILINSSNVPYFFLRDNGTTYSVNAQVTLSTNQWNHLAFTWDASTNAILTYINGVQVTGLSGGSSSVGIDNIMAIGARTDGQQIYKGSIDEFRIWDDIRTPCEIYAGLNTNFTVAQPNLVAAYSFDQGVPNGINSGVTTLNDLGNTYNATLNNFTLSGSSSNWVTSGASISQTNNNSEAYLSSDVIAACGSYNWIDGNTYFTDNNSATYNYTSVAGCDSIVQLNLTIDAPITADAPGNITVCDNYTLPSLTAGNYYTESNGGGTILNVGDLISSSQTVYVYAENGTCSDENSFTITIDSPVNADTPINVSSCDSYELPVLANGNYYTESNGGGTILNAGDLISSSQTVYVYAENGTCSDENSFTVTIDSPVSADVISNVNACDNYQLPSITTGNYYTESTATGVMLNVGDTITNTQTIYVYVENGTCSDENSFIVTIDDSPVNTVSVNNNTLTADQSGAMYKWLDCNNGNAEIVGATSQSFTPTTNGSYAAEITMNSCTTYSVCTSILTIGLTENIDNQIKLFPNPTNGMITLIANQKMIGQKIKITDIYGKFVREEVINNEQLTIDLSTYKTGVYLIEFNNLNQLEKRKIIKN